ncbi:hypothetical protein [Nonomuraea longicatena]|uniref:Uncharacterized protein n=1 Tax=Nonomuraea longicatena TaxID=83682 RepID=A0ABP3Z0N6_9ACTN
MSTDPLPLLWLHGPPGVGASSVGWEVFSRLGRDGVTTAFADGDRLGLCYPVPDGDTLPLRARALAALWPNLRAAGARGVVMSGVLDGREELDLYAKLLPDAQLMPCRLRVPPEVLRARYLSWGWRPDLAEAAVADALADDDDLGGTCLDLGELGVTEAARLVCEQAVTWDASPADPPAAHWPGASPATEPIIWFSGPTAVGRSTVTRGVFSQLVLPGVPVAYVDVKQLCAVRPAPADPRPLVARNLATLWECYRDAGARVLMVSGGPDSDQDVAAYLAYLPEATPMVFRLHASREALAERVEARGRGTGPKEPGDELHGLDADSLAAVAARAAAEAARMEQADMGDIRIETTGRSVYQTVVEIIQRLSD